MAGGADTERLWLEVAMRLGGDNREILRALGEIKQAQAEAVKSTGDLADQARKAGSAFSDVANIVKGLGIFEVLKRSADAAYGFHRSTMAGVAALPSLADRLGVTTDELQAYHAAMRNANVTTDEGTRLLFTFRQRVGEAAEGNKQAIETFNRLGVNILDANGKVRPTPDLLRETAISLLRMEDGSVRAAVGAQVLSDKGARLTPLLRELGVPIGQLVERGKAFGEIVDREIAEKLDRAKNTAEAAEARIRALYAVFGAPVQAEAMGIIARQMAEIAASIALMGAHRSTIDRLFELLNISGGGLGGRLAGVDAPTRALQAIAESEERVVKARQELRRIEQLPAGGALQSGGKERGIEQQKKVVQELEAELLKAQQAYIEFDRRRKAAEDLARPPPPGTPTTTGAGNPPPRGGAGASRDRIGEALNQLKGEVAAAQAAYDQLRAGYGVPLEELEREVELRKKIADEIAKLGKYDPGDPRVQQIKDLVRAHEELETRIKQVAEANRNAVEIERRMGDGTAFLAEQTRILNEALDTGRLSYEAYAAQMRDAADKAEDMRLKLLGQQEGFEGLVAGMQYAAVQWDRQNRAFQVGQRIFQSVTQEMSQALSDLVTKGEMDFNRLLGSFVNMLSQMAMQAAVSGLFNLAAGALGNLFSAGAGAAMSPGQTMNTYAGLPDWFARPGFAEGGRPPVGEPSIVGERGPELFVPDTAGTIVPNRLLGGGGETRIVVENHIQVGSFATRAEVMTMGAIIEQRSREGAMAALVEGGRRNDPRFGRRRRG